KSMTNPPQMSKLQPRSELIADKEEYKVAHRLAEIKCQNAKVVLYCIYHHKIHCLPHLQADKMQINSKSIKHSKKYTSPILTDVSLTVFLYAQQGGGKLRGRVALLLFLFIFNMICWILELWYLTLARFNG
ncbi:MAG: hypothetical protein JSW26_12040, partial [Desulfobacterales bacterium]